MTETIMILAAGMSSRMKKSDSDELNKSKIEEANKKSKSLISFGKEGKPFIYFLLDNIIKAGYKNLILVVGKDYSDFEKSINKYKDSNQLKISFAIQKIPIDRVKPFGTADAVSQAIHQFPHLKSESYCVCNSDNLYSVNALKLIRENDFENAVLAYDRDSLEFPAERVSSFSIMTMNLEMNLLNFIEKPTKEQVNQNLDENGKIRVSMNIFKFTGKYSSDFIINCPINPLRNEKELPSAIMNMITSSESYMRAIPIAEHVPDLTSKKDIAILEKLIN